MSCPRPRRQSPSLLLPLLPPLLLLLLPLAAGGRSLLVADDDPGFSEAYPMDDPKYEFSRDIPLSDPRLRKPGGKGCDTPVDGLRLTHWGPGAVLASFSTCDPVIFPPAPGRPAVDGPAPESKPPPPPPPLAEGDWAVEIRARGASGRHKMPDLLRRVPVDPGFTLQYESHFPDRANGDSYAGGYRSGRLSHVLLDGLEPGALYSYRVVRRRVEQQPQHRESANSSLSAAAESKGGRGSRVVWEPKSPLAKFEAPWPPSELRRAAAAAKGGKGRKDAFYRIGIVGDPGQTPDSARTIAALGAADPRTIVILGDISYADDFLADGTPQAGGSVARPDWYSQPGNGEQTFEYKADTCHRLWSPLASRVPLLTLTGNHDYLSHNYTGDRKNKVGTYFLAYNARFPVPNGGGHWSLPFAPGLPPPSASPPMPPKEQLDAVPTATAGLLRSGAPSNLFYVTELPGATIVVATPYIPADFGPGTATYIFLEKTLAAVDRERTPWLIFATHSSLYTTYRGHFKEQECWRLQTGELESCTKRGRAQPRSAPFYLQEIESMPGKKEITRERALSGG